MKKFMSIALLVGMLGFAGLAQAEPKAEVFGGFQFNHLDPNFNAAGWNASLTGNLNSWFGVTGDFGGSYKSGTKFHTYTFGPQFKARLPIVQPFVHALFGGGTASGGGSTSGFVMFYGGGVDMGHGPFAFRIIQADWEVTRFSGFTDKKNTRISTGIVLRF